MKLKVILGIVIAVVALFVFGVIKPGQLQLLQCRSKQSEAKSMLKEASKRLAEAGQKNNGQVPRTWDLLAWSPHPAKPRYDYNIVEAAGSTFRVEARANSDEMNGDVWEIDDAAHLVNKVNGCAAVRR